MEYLRREKDQNWSNKCLQMSQHSPSRKREAIRFKTSECARQLFCNSEILKAIQDGWTISPTVRSEKASPDRRTFDWEWRVGVLQIEKMTSEFPAVARIARTAFAMQTRWSNSGKAWEINWSSGGIKQELFILCSSKQLMKRFSGRLLGKTVKLKQTKNNLCIIRRNSPDNAAFVCCR